MSPEIASRRGRLVVRLTVTAFVWSVGLVIAAVLVPVYSGHTETSSSGLTITTATLVEENGWWVLLPVAVPAAICVVVGAALRRKWTSGGRWSGRVAWVAIGTLAISALLAILSIGIFVVPVALLLAIAAVLTPEGYGQLA
jgi:hypothetical protein